jgi:hypothetical protein
MDHEGGLPGFSHGYATEAGVVTDETIVAEWLGLSLEVSVVAYQLNGIPIGWQSPVGGLSSLRLDERPERYLAVAYDAVGVELDRFETALDPLDGYPTAESPSVSSTPGADWEPMTSEGFEIMAADLASAALRDEIDPQPGDRLFLVPVDGSEIIVRVRAGVAHVYSESCAALDGIDLPSSWEETCLE